MRWNLEKKPDKCQETEDGVCNNKAYSKNKIGMGMWYWVCRKHHERYNLGK